MTRQTPNSVIYKNRTYWITEYYTPLFEPLSDQSVDLSSNREESNEQLRRTMLRTLSCRRGYILTFVIRDWEFILDSILLRTNSPPPLINNQLPVESPPSDTRFDYHYKNLNFKTGYSGNITIEHKDGTEKILGISNDVVTSVITRIKVVQLEEQETPLKCAYCERENRKKYVTYQYLPGKVFCNVKCAENMYRRDKGHNL